MGEDLNGLLAAALERKGRAASARGDRATLRACIGVLRGRTTKAARAALSSLEALNSGEPVSRRAKTKAPFTTARRSSGPGRAWLEKVERIADEFESDGIGGCAVYLVLFKRDGEYGLHVGQTAKPIVARFREHKSGIKAGRGIVRDYGVRPLSGATRHLRRMSRTLAETVERRLWNRLKRAGFLVEGGH